MILPRSARGEDQGLDLPGFVESVERTSRGQRSNAMGLRKASDECRRTGLQDPSTYPAMAFSACWRVCQATGQISSGLMALKNVSTIELS